MAEDRIRTARARTWPVLGVGVGMMLDTLPYTFWIGAGIVIASSLILVPWERLGWVRTLRQRNHRRVLADMMDLIAVLDRKATNIHDRYHQMNRIAILCARYPEWFPEDADIGEVRDSAHSIIGSIERKTGKFTKEDQS